MLSTAGLSKEWWGETILTMCHVLNRVPRKNKKIAPFEEWKKRILNLSYLRIWGCLTKVNMSINKKHKLRPKTVDGLFLCYSFHSTRCRRQDQAQLHDHCSWASWWIPLSVLWSPPLERANHAEALAIFLGPIRGHVSSVLPSCVWLLHWTHVSHAEPLHNWKLSVEVHVSHGWLFLLRPV
jgi:hypothetical protein